MLEKIPKAYGFYSSIKQLIGSFVVAAIGFGVAYWLHTNGNSSASYAMVGLGLLGTIMVILSFVGLRQLQKSNKTPQQFTQFQTRTAANFEAPVGTTQEVPSAVNEQLVNSLGPVLRSGLGVASYQILNKEVNRSGENTLLFTPTRIVAVMLGPADIQNADTSAVQGIMGKVLEAMPETSVEKNVQFETLYMNKWQTMVEALVAQGLSVALQNHYNFSIPYSDIEKISLNKGFVNTGLTIQLRNGTKISYSVLNRDRLEPALQAVAAYVAVE